MKDAWIYIEGPISDADLAHANTHLATLRTQVPTPEPVAFALEPNPGPGRHAEAYFTDFTIQWLHIQPMEDEGGFTEDDYADTDWPYLAAYLQAAIDCWPHHNVVYSDESLTTLDLVEPRLFDWLPQLWDDPEMHAWAQQEGTGTCTHRHSTIEARDSRSPLRIPAEHNRPIVDWNCSCGLRVQLPGTPATPDVLRALSDENFRLVATMTASGIHTFAEAIAAAEATDD